MAADNAQLLLSIDATTEILRAEIAKGTAALEKFASKSEHDAERVAKSFERMGEKAKETAVEFAKLGAEILIGQGIKEAIEKAIEYSETLVKTGQQLGVTTKFLQEFRFAATQTATSAEAADKSLAKFSVTLGRAADGNKVAAEAFSKIGVKIADSAGNLRPTEAIFRDVADAIAKIPSPAGQASAAVALFGRGGQSLLPILLAGADGFNKFGVEADKAGLVLADNTIEHLEELSNATKKVKNEISAELARVIGDNAEALIHLGEAAGEAAHLSIATNAGAIFGSARYVAPECAAGGASSPSSDVYALATLGYECLSGKAPFDGENAIQVLLKQQNQAVPPLRNETPGRAIAEALGVFIERNLAKAPEARSADARVFARELVGAAREAGLDPGLSSRTRRGHAVEALAASAVCFGPPTPDIQQDAIAARPPRLAGNALGRTLFVLLCFVVGAGAALGIATNLGIFVEKSSSGQGQPKAGTP